MTLASYENAMTMIGLARHPKNSGSSQLALLPNDVLSRVLEFAELCGRGEASNARRRAATARTKSGTSLNIVPFAGMAQYIANIDLNLADMSIYTPGRKIVIPLSLPNLHLTAPCYRGEFLYCYTILALLFSSLLNQIEISHRYYPHITTPKDLRKHVKKHANWDLKRIAATPVEKKQYRQTRKGTVYFINAVYSVPKSSLATATASSTTTTDKRKKGATLTTGKRKKVDDRKSPPEALSPEMQSRATSALNDLIRSVHVLDDTMTDGIKEADPVMYQRALDAGYSKFFLDATLAANSGTSIEGDAKPPAKLTKTEVEE